MCVAGSPRMFDFECEGTEMERPPRPEEVVSCFLPSLQRLYTLSPGTRRAASGAKGHRDKPGKRFRVTDRSSPRCRFVHGSRLLAG